MGQSKGKFILLWCISVSSNLSAIFMCVSKECSNFGGKIFSIPDEELFLISLFLFHAVLDHSYCHYFNRCCGSGYRHWWVPYIYSSCTSSLTVLCFYLSLHDPSLLGCFYGTLCVLSSLLLPCSSVAVVLVEVLKQRE